MTKAETTQLGRVEKKIDELFNHFLDPDDGVYSRVAKNTAWRRRGQWILYVLLAGNLGAMLWIKLF